jgi:hypothetical protein
MTPQLERLSPAVARVILNMKALSALYASCPCRADERQRNPPEDGGLRRVRTRLTHPTRRRETIVSGPEPRSYRREHLAT